MKLSIEVSVTVQGLGRESAYAQTLGRICMAVVQAVLMYGLETWTMRLRMGRELGRFHHRVACRMTGQLPRRGREGRWIYLPLEEAMEESGLQEVETYVSRFQNTVSQFIDTRPIMDLCLAAERRLGSRVNKRLWEQ